LLVAKNAAHFFRMPRYYFSLESSSGTIAAHEDGEELPDDAAAHAAALQTARELGDWDRVSHASILVKTEDGRIVTEVPLNPLLN
jgi:uncharacterized protein DUF6894